MARITRARRHCARRLRSTLYPIPFSLKKSHKDGKSRKALMAPKKKRDWIDATCSVCMECPHNAVLLLCSSHEKGCRPYMCGTGYRHSNCLDQFKKAYIKVAGLREAASGTPSGNTDPSPGSESEKTEVSELACPLCRGQVKGWAVVEPARQYLDSKKRTCMQDGCSFVGNYKELRKHVKLEHPSAKPREVDPVVEQKWRTFEREQERQDVIGTIRSSMPRALVLGDYVVDFDSEDDGDDGIEAVDQGIGRSLVYFLMREGARIMTLRGDGVGSETDGARTGDAPQSYLFDSGEEDQFIVHPRGINHRERRGRRRSRGWPESGPS